MNADDIARYREQAEYCQQQAKRASDPKEKETWLKIAADWLQMIEAAKGRKTE